jgi:Rieske Fe-S protein
MKTTDSPRGDCTACNDCVARRAFLVRFGTSLAVAAIALAADVPVASALDRRRVAEPHVSEPKRYPIPSADGATIDADEDVILMRWQGSVYAFALSCPHQNTALRWRAEDVRFQCPKHKSQYRPDGSFIEGRATRGMDRYAIHRDGESVVVEMQTLYKSSDDPQGWAAAVVKLA